MADYWKSNAKKYCKICNVWYADNRVSIENHERGPAHKAMLQKSLRNSSKEAKKRELEQAELNATLVAMEAAALAAMKRDGIPIQYEIKTKYNVKKE